MEQDRKPRDKPTHIWVPCLWKEAKIYNGKDSLFNVAGKTGQLCVKEWN